MISGMMRRREDASIEGAKGKISTPSPSHDKRLLGRSRSVAVLRLGHQLWGMVQGFVRDWVAITSAWEYCYNEISFLKSREDRVRKWDFAA